MAASDAVEQLKEETSSDKKSLKDPCAGSSIGIGNTGRLPCINTVVEGETVDTGSRGKRDIVGPNGLYVRVGVADHMVSVEGLSA